MLKLDRRQEDKITYLLALSDLVGGCKDLSVCHEIITRLTGLEAGRALAARQLLLNEKELQGKDLTETRITKKGLKTVEAIFTPLREGLFVGNPIESDGLVAEGRTDENIGSYIDEYYLLKDLVQFVNKEVDEFLKRLESRITPSENRNTY